MGRATIRYIFLFLTSDHFNPRPPRGGRHTSREVCYNKRAISIHALHGDGDAPYAMRIQGITISIHALHGEGDNASRAEQAASTAISIHALHGEGD